MVLIICPARGSLCLHYFNLEPLLSKHPASWIAHLSLCIFFINYKIPVFNQLSPCILPILSMHPARMVAYLSQCIFLSNATCQDGCPCILPGGLLVSHCALPLCNRQARRDKRLAPVYYAICPFSLSRLILIHVILLKRPFPFLISYPYSSEAFYYTICPINLAFLFFLLARPFIMLFVHFLFLITSLSFSESVYRAIRPFGFSITCLSSSELVS